MSILSSTTLFNFTDKFEYLKDNLLNGFYATTTYEKLPKRNNGYSVPMVCFCDIPLSMIKDHLNWYGNYGVGIKRSYARDHGVTPVFYMHSNSTLLNLILNKKKHNDVVLRMFPLIKQFLGKQNLNGVNKRKKFYNEREWRYIPPDINVEVHLSINQTRAKQIMNKALYRMKIDYSAIEYIIVDSAKDIKLLLKVFDTIISKNKRVNREILISKILTVSQIRRDF